MSEAKHDPFRFLYGLPPCPVVVICPCGQWHRAPLRATEEYHFRLPCGLFVQITHEEAGPFIQFYWKSHVIEITDLAAGCELLYVHLRMPE